VLFGGSLEEFEEDGVRREDTGLIFGVELGSDIERVIFSGKFDRFN